MHDENSMEWDKLVEQHGEENSLEIADTLRILKAKIRTCKACNNRLIESEEIFAKAQLK